MLKWWETEGESSFHLTDRSMLSVSCSPWLMPLSTGKASHPILGLCLSGGVQIWQQLWNTSRMGNCLQFFLGEKKKWKVRCWFWLHSHILLVDSEVLRHITHIPWLLRSWLQLGLASVCCLSITIDQGPATSLLLQPYQENYCNSNSAKLRSSLPLLLQNWIIRTTLWPSSDLYIHS